MSYWGFDIKNNGCSTYLMSNLAVQYGLNVPIGLEVCTVHTLYIYT